MEKRILLLGAGKVGSLIACLLSKEKDYQVVVSDFDPKALDKLSSRSGVKIQAIDLEDEKALTNVMSSQEFDAVVSALPFYCNPQVANLAKTMNLHYFDLTEDVEVTHKIKSLAQDAEKAFVPQGGLAPGFISIATQNILDRFESLEAVKMRVGALPLHPNNALKYSLTWSTDGLINEYGNPCEGIRDGKKTTLQPLGGLETIEMDGLLYEAFNTSGGLGTLADSCLGKVKEMDYKTLRYPGHRDKIKLLMNDLKLNQDRPTLKRILEKAVPKTRQDVVLIYASATGLIKGELYEETYFKKIYAAEIEGELWSAIQITTGSSLCAILDLVLENPSEYRGFVPQERFGLKDFLANRFGLYFR